MSRCESCVAPLSVENVTVQVYRECTRMDANRLNHRGSDLARIRVHWRPFAVDHLNSYWKTLRLAYGNRASARLQASLFRPGR